VVGNQPDDGFFSAASYNDKWLPNATMSATAKNGNDGRRPGD
jgi:hypothetical protein